MYIPTDPSTYKQIVVSEGLEGIVYGLHIVLFGLCVRLYWKRQKSQSRAAYIIFVAMFFTFLLSSFFWSLSLKCKFDSPDIVSASCVLGRSGSGDLIFLANDLVVIWRAKCLWRGRQWLVLIPLAPLTGMIASGLATFISYVMVAQVDPVQDSAKFQTMFWRAFILQFAGQTFSLLTNLVATILIARTAGLVRRDAASPKAGIALSSIVDSGFAYLLLQTVAVSLYMAVLIQNSTVDAALSAAQGISITLLTLLAGLFPPLVYVLVQHESLLSDSEEVGSRVKLTTIEFGEGPIRHESFCPEDETS